MYQYWYNIGLLQEIYGETVAKFKFIALE